MEFKRIPFIAVQRKFNLTDRQMYYIRDRIRKYHKEDEWSYSSTTQSEKKRTVDLFGRCALDRGSISSI